jgi:hypothetical protein
MPSVPPIPVELWDQIPPAAQAAILELDCDGVLHQRDSPQFDEEWARIESAVKKYEMG